MYLDYTTDGALKSRAERLLLLLSFYPNLSQVFYWDIPKVEEILDKP